MNKKLPEQSKIIRNVYLKQTNRLVYLCATTAIGIALLSLVGWVTGLRILAGQWGNLIPMAPLTALFILLIGSAMLSYIRWPRKRISRIFVPTALCIILLVALIMLGQSITGIDLGIENLLFKSTELLGQIPIGHMSPLTAISFILESAAFLLLIAISKYRKPPVISALLVMTAMGMNFIFLVGYAYGAPLLYGGTTIPVSFVTALTFMLIGVGQISLLWPRIPQLQRWNRTTFRGLLLRSFLPFIFIFTLVEGWVNATFDPLISNPSIFHSLAALVAGILSVTIIVWISERTGHVFEDAQAQISSLARFPEENPNLVLRISKSGHLLYANPGSLPLLNFWKCKKPGDILPEEQCRLIKTVIRRGIIQRREITIGEIIYELVYSPIQGQDYLNLYGTEITERRKAEKELRESEERFRSLFKDSPVALWEQDFSAVKRRLDTLQVQGVTDMQAYLDSHPQEAVDCISLIKIMDVNKAAVDCYKAKDENDLKRNLSKILSPQSYLDFNKELAAVAEGKTKFSWESHNLTLTGEPIDVSLVWSAVPGFERDLSKVFVSIVDITARKKIERALQDSESELRGLFASMKDLVIIYNQEGRYLNIATTDSSLLIKPSRDLLNKTIYEVFSKEEAKRFILHINNVIKTQRTIPIEYSLEINHKKVWFNASVSPLNNNRVIWVARDITDRKLMEEETLFISIHDGLTKLYNRTFYEEELSRLVNSRLFPVSILMIDVDGLKKINDTLGHPAGDEMLLRTAKTLLESFRAEDMVARIGGDEFVAILPNTNENAAHLALERINHFLDLNNRNQPNILRISIGTATCEQQGSLQDTVKLADDRMYQEKRSKG